MQRHTIRHTVTTGSFTLTAAVVLSLALWAVADPSDPALWAGLCAVLPTAYLVRELNNRFALLRVRSRMMSATFMALMLVLSPLHAWHTELLCLPLLALSLLMLFDTYQDAACEGRVYHAFLFTGLGALIFPPLCALAAAYVWAMLFQLRTLTLRTLRAALLGLLTPLWFYAAYVVWTDGGLEAFRYLWAWVPTAWPDYTVWGQTEWAMLGFVGLFTLVPLIHFVRTAYNDKIRTRMYFYLLLTTEAVLALGLAFLPGCYDTLLSLLALNSSFFIGHYYTLARGRLADFFFLLTLILFAAFGAYLVWMPSYRLL